MTVRRTLSFSGQHRPKVRQSDVTFRSSAVPTENAPLRLSDRILHTKDDKLYPTPFTHGLDAFLCN